MSKKTRTGRWWQEKLADSKDLPKEEGHTIEPRKGKKPPKVKDVEKYLVTF